MNKFILAIVSTGFIFLLYQHVMMKSSSLPSGDPRNIPSDVVIKKAVAKSIKDHVLTTTLGARENETNNDAKHANEVQSIAVSSEVADDRLEEGSNGNSGVSKKVLSNQDEIILGSSLSLAEIDAISLKNKEIFDSWKSSPEKENVLGTAYTLAQMNSVSQHNKITYDEMKSDKGSRILGTDFTVLEIEEMGQHNSKLYDKLNKTTENYILGVNLTVEELNTSH